MKNYVLVEYNDKKYYVWRYDRINGDNMLFVIDFDDLQKILDLNHSLYYVNGYVGYSEMINRVTYQHYIHNIIMNKPIGGGKGQKYTIDHINRNTHDNRKANLRLISQSQQNENQKRRVRKCELPENCGIDIDELPKCVYYRKSDGNHGDRFTIELTNNKQKRSWSSTTSTKVSLQDKLIEIKKILLNISKEYPS